MRVCIQVSIEYISYSILSTFTCILVLNQNKHILKCTRPIYVALVTVWKVYIYTTDHACISQCDVQFKEQRCCNIMLLLSSRHKCYFHTVCANHSVLLLCSDKLKLFNDCIRTMSLYICYNQQHVSVYTYYFYIL